MKKELNFRFINAAAKRDFLNLPKDIISQFGSDLNAVQQGQRPFSDFEDLSSTIGAGVIELKENGSPAYRAVYCAKHLNTVYILHAFTKTTNGVDRPAMNTVLLRYKEMMAEVSKMKNANKKQTKPH
ncbi:MAG: type II toxin-antitoxin system RelE/ParE family toxin [Cellvibrio sp.]|jgi:phage-related protein|nr:type II toxin-antitoxin system RelE/ParE family toxin [Cellvibrio sp.]